MSDAKHLPVMVSEVLGSFEHITDGAILDLTVGLGGHLKAMSEKLSPQISLYGIDRDPQAIAIAQENLKNIQQVKQLTVCSYSQIDQAIINFGDKKFDGLLMDLGISSYQIDSPERGFAFSSDGPLDMRFDAQSGERTAADLINSLSEKELAKIFKEYGEERNAFRIARVITQKRDQDPIQTTAQLKDLIAGSVKGQYQTKTLARIFQALRIAVNNELEKLKESLPVIFEYLKPGGRLSVLTYHSLEDRIVKRFFQRLAKGCICPPHFAICVCGLQPTLTIVTKKAVLPTEEEIALNSRARSAKLRVAEKI